MLFLIWRTFKMSTQKHLHKMKKSFFGDLDATGGNSLNSVPVRRSDPIAQQSCQRQILGTNCQREAAARAGSWPDRQVRKSGGGTENFLGQVDWRGNFFLNELNNASEKGLTISSTTNQLKLSYQPALLETPQYRRSTGPDFKGNKKQAIVLPIKKELTV